MKHHTHQQTQKDHEKATKTNRVNELYLDKKYTEKIHIICKDFISSLSLSLFLILGRVMLQAFCQRERGDVTR